MWNVKKKKEGDKGDKNGGDTQCVLYGSDMYLYTKDDKKYARELFGYYACDTCVERFAHLSYDMQILLGYFDHRIGVLEGREK